MKNRCEVSDGSSSKVLTTNDSTIVRLRFRPKYSVLYPLLPNFCHGGECHLMTTYLLTLPLCAGVSRVRALSPAWKGLLSGRH